MESLAKNDLDAIKSKYEGKTIRGFTIKEVFYSESNHRPFYPYRATCVCECGSEFTCTIKQVENRFIKKGI